LLKLAKENEEEFFGSFLLLKIKLNVLENKDSTTSGKVQYLAEVKMPWSFGRSQTIAYLKYNASEDGNTMLTLRCDFRTKGVVMATYFPLIKCRINAFLKKLFRNFEKASNLLENSNEMLAKRLSDEQLDRINTYRMSLDSNHIKDPIGRTSKKVEVLENSIISLGKKLEILSKEIKDAVSHAESDPSASLGKARTALEKLLLSLYRKVMSKEPKKYEIGYMLNDNQFTKNIKPRILSRMHSVRNMGNIALHTDSGEDNESYGDRIMPRDATEALEDLSVIIRWYIEQYGSDQEDNTPEVRFTATCKEYYKTGLPDSEAKIQIELLRKEFGFTPEKAMLLEKKTIPPEIRELMGAIDVVYADGMMNENKKTHLYKKAEELDIKKELATQLIEEYCEVLEDSLEKQYGDLCKKYYCNSIPSAQQRSELVALQQSLGLSDSEAKQIERKIMPREILELQVMIETFYVDGMMKENEKTHLHKKAKELRINSELAERLIEECCELMENTIEAQYLSFCQQFYQETIPTLEQREKLNQKRIQLRLTKETAKEIEKSCVPDNIDKYRAAIEGIYADSRIDDKERTYLKKKAKELNLSPEIAQQIENEYLNEEV
jgi:uncharacterized tellurite resistance protein B-like protein